MRYRLVPKDAEYFNFENGRFAKIDDKGFLWYWNHNNLSWVRDSIIPKRQLDKMVKQDKIARVIGIINRLDYVLFIVFMVVFYFISNFVIKGVL